MNRKRKSRALARRYQAALRRHLARPPTASLAPAVALGQQAVAMRLETLDLALIHEEALIAQVLPLATARAGARTKVIERAKEFFAQAIVPMEKTHRLALEANIHLRLLNLAMSRRTRELASSNRELKKQIARRHAAEKTLRRSEQRSVRLLEQSRNMQEQLKLLSRRVLSVQEEERKRISRELHDVIAQVLTGINVRLASLKVDAAMNTRGLGRQILRTQRLVERSVEIVHRFARELRPAVLDDLGLVPALHSFLKRFMQETGIRTSLAVFAGVEQLSAPKRTALYRVAQEALTNVARHAQASAATVTIRRVPRAVQMEIQDDGKAFDPDRVLQARKARHLGLLGMRERVEMVGGTFAVESTPGKGTRIRVNVPFNTSAKERAHP